MSGEAAPGDGYLPGITVYVEHLPLPVGARFASHAHREHQLVWTTSSSILVGVGAHTWVLPPTLALWVPAGVEHATSAPRSATMRGIWVHPQIASPWAEPTVVVVTAVVRELIDLLADVDLLGPTRERAEHLLLDLLRPVRVHAINLPMPVDPRALAVARHLEQHPSEAAGIERWGRQVGASGRTLSRLFVEETGLTFTQWRTTARLRTALTRIAAGDPIAAIACDSGYSTPSSFIAAFRRTTGETPGRYFRDPAVR